MQYGLEITESHWLWSPATKRRASKQTAGKPDTSSQTGTLSESEKYRRRKKESERRIRELERIEKLISEKENTLAALAIEMGDPRVFSDQAESLRVGNAAKSVKDELENLYWMWEQLADSSD